MKNNNILNAFWQGADNFRNELESSEYIDLQVIALTHMYIESNKNLAKLIPNDQLWSDITASGYGLQKRLQGSLSLLEVKFPFLNNVFEYIRIPNEINEATLFRFTSTINKFQKPSPDEFGNLFEELINKFVEQHGKNSGEFVSPSSISKLLPQLLDVKSGDVYDGAPGINQFLVEAKRYGEKNGSIVSLYGQELNGKTWAIGKIHLFILGLIDSQVAKGNTLLDPLFTEGHALKTFDYIIMNPPFGLSKWGRDKVKNEMWGRFIYGLPSDANADMAFISHTVASLKENGKAAIVVPHGILFRGGADGKIRKELIQADLIESVIGLPANLFINTSIPVVVLVINKNKPKERKGKVLFIDASKEFKSMRRQNILDEKHIKRIVEAYRSEKEDPEIRTMVTVEEIMKTDANLSISKYFTVNEIEGKFGSVKVNLQTFENSPVPKKPLYEVAETFRGYNIPSVGKIENPDGEFRAIQLVNVQDGILQTNQLEKVNIKDASKVKNYLVKEGDIIISNRGAAIKVAVVPKVDGNIILGHNFHGIRPKAGMNSLYIKAYLESPIGQGYIQSLQQGTMVQVLGLKELNNLLIPLQSFGIQEDIGKEIQKAEEAYQKAIKEANEKRQDAYRDFYKVMGIRESYQNI
ncbi:N-6 DNA methylase [Peribacillus simplex]